MIFVIDLIIINWCNQFSILCNVKIRMCPKFFNRIFKLKMEHNCFLSTWKKDVETSCVIFTAYILLFLTLIIEIRVNHNFLK